MADPTASQDDAANEPAGKTRTWWHPLLVRMLDVVLHDAYEIRDEVHVGKMPLRLDIVLIRRHGGVLPESAHRDLASLVPRLNHWTLLEFKSPSDALQRGDLDTLLGCAHLFRAQEAKPIGHHELSLVVLAPEMNGPFRDDLELSGFTAQQEQEGVHRIDGPVFATWMLETDRVAGLREPYLSCFSRVFLRRDQGIIEQLREAGYGHVLSYLVQQIQQFQSSGEAFAMQYQHIEDMDAALDAALAALPVERRLKGLSPKEVMDELRAEKTGALDAALAALPVERRLKGLSPADILRVLASDKILGEFSAEELERLRELAQQRKEDDPKE